MSWDELLSSEDLEPSDHYHWDTMFDRFSRVIMPNALLVSAIFVAANWWRDKITCDIPPSVTLNTPFIQNVCWIEGFYVYKEIGFNNLHGLYGIPTHINNDGKFIGTNKLCTRNMNGTVDKLCEPMHKSLYYQYQLHALRFYCYVP